MQEPTSREPRSCERGSLLYTVPMQWTQRDLDMRSLIAGRTVERLQKGDPILGWAGDPFMVLTFDRVSECWEVFRDVCGEVSLVARKHGELDPDKLIRELVARDSQGRGHRDTVDDMITQNEQVQADQARRAEEAMAEADAHFRFAAKKDGLL